ncbi:MAG: hypothetical protein WBJ75_04100, partial [Pseudohongiellaceae bacterium]
RIAEVRKNVATCVRMIDKSKKVGNRRDNSNMIRPKQYSLETFFFGNTSFKSTSWSSASGAGQVLPAFAGC